MFLELGLTNIQFTVTDDLKYVEGQDNIKELRKPMSDFRDKIMKLSLEDEGAMDQTVL